MKRSRKGDSLTGGTGDVKPQIMTLAGAASAAVDDYRVDQFSMPIVRPQAGSSKATIVELLWVDWYLNIEDSADTGGADYAFLTVNTNRSTADTSTYVTFAADVADPRTIAPVLRSRSLTTSGVTTADYPIRVDLTDQAGNGILYAADQITIVAGDVAGTTGSRTIAKICYRFYSASLTEYIGIVQSQQ